MSRENHGEGTSTSTDPAVDGIGTQEESAAAQEQAAAEPTGDSGQPPGGAHRAAPADQAGAPAPASPNGQASTDADAIPADADPDAGAPAAAAELQSLRTELDERVRDLQRVTAEYANYRKRVDRDRALVVEQASGNVIATLLPVLDDLDRAREHGDLIGPFATVADQLTGALSKFGLTAFGSPGEPFDPTRHEAVAHSTSADVAEPTCVAVMRRGYLIGERLLRPALVAVADPQ